MAGHETSTALVDHGVLRSQISKAAVLVDPSSLMSAPMREAPSSSIVPARKVPPTGLLQALARVPDPRDPRGVRYHLPTLLATGCA